MYSLCENIVDMSYSMMNPENWILGNKNSCQVFSNLPTSTLLLQVVQVEQHRNIHVLSRLSTFIFPRDWSLEVDKLTRIFFSLMIALSVLMDDFLSLTMDDFFFPRIFWVD